jgi:hypothetical protein
VLGLVGQSECDTATDSYAALGTSMYFERTAIAGSRWPGYPPARDANAVAHEFGHLLGAWHCARTDDSIMAPGSVNVTRFDPHATAVLALTRTFDFRRGVAGLDPSAAEAIDAIWRASDAGDRDQPVAFAFMQLGYRDLAAGRRAAAESHFLRAVSILEAAAGKDDPGLMPSLIGLARCASESDAEAVRAGLAHAVRARHIGEVSGNVEDPVAASWMQLGRCLWANGRDEDSIAAYRSAYVLRIRAYGSVHTSTLEAKQALQWFADRGHPSADLALAQAQHEAWYPATSTK